MGVSKPFSDDEELYDYTDLTSRMKQTLYYDPVKDPDKDTLSYSVTESAVAYICDVAPMSVGKLGHRYASRVARDACISPCALLLGLIYIERLKNKNPKYLDNISSSELFLVSMVMVIFVTQISVYQMVSSKYLYDEGCEEEVFNDEWAISGNVTVARVNTLEKEFLHAIDWHLYVHQHEFSSMLNIAESDIALLNSRKRGWLTYRDLMSLLNSQKICDRLNQAARIMSKVTCVCVIVYSGIVCVTAATSVAIVALSTKSNGRPFGPHIKSERLHLEKNLSEQDSTVDDLPESGGMFSSSPDIRRLNRHKINSAIISLPVSTDHDFKSNDVLGIGRVLNPQNDLCNDKIRSQRAKDEGCSISALLEAILVMSNVPPLCLQEYEMPTKKCPNCGKLNSDLKSGYQYYKRFSSRQKLPHQMFHNYSMLAHHWDGWTCLEPDLHHLKTGKVLGIYNPTLPPILSTPVDPKHSFLAMEA